MMHRKLWSEWNEACNRFILWSFWVLMIFITFVRTQSRQLLHSRWNGEKWWALQLETKKNSLIAYCYKCSFISWIARIANSLLLFIVLQNESSQCYRIKLNILHSIFINHFIRFIDALILNIYVFPWANYRFICISTASATFHFNISIIISGGVRCSIFGLHRNLTAA